MEEDLSLSLELGSCFTKRRVEKLSKEGYIDNHGELGIKTETEKKLGEPLIMHLSLSSVPSEMKNKRTESYGHQVTKITVQESNRATPSLSATSQHSTTSSQQEKRSNRDKEKENDHNISDSYVAEISDIATINEEENSHARKKLRLSKEQALLLEENFRKHATLNPKLKVKLAKQLSLQPRQVEVWFQNRRARTKLEQTAIDCRYLKHWYQVLSQENLRLKREMAELRAFSTAYANAPYPFYKHVSVTGLPIFYPSCVHSHPTVFGNTTPGPADHNPAMQPPVLSKSWF